MISLPFQGGVDATSRKCREASYDGADGVVSKFQRKFPCLRAEVCHRKTYNHPSKKAFRKVPREAHIAPEAVLWNSLKNRQLGVKFRRQSPYFVDFYCPACRLVIELDGAAHFSQTGDEDEYDAKRTKYLEAEGLTIIRFENEFLRTDLDGVLATIKQHLQKSRQDILELTNHPVCAGCGGFATLSWRRSHPPLERRGIRGSRILTQQSAESIRRRRPLTACRGHCIDTSAWCVRCPAEPVSWHGSHDRKSAAVPPC